jgi:hypothetical protein
MLCLQNILNDTPFLQPILAAMRKDGLARDTGGYFCLPWMASGKNSETVGINQQRISQITNNAKFGNIGNLLSHGHDMESTTCSI